MSYLRREFMTYAHTEIGLMNPWEYCNELDNIEELLSVDIEVEFQKNQCRSLYNRLQQLRKTPETIGKNEHAVIQYESILSRYIDFRRLKQASDVPLNNQIQKKIRGIISSYKANFEQANKDERYKWEAIGWYKQHWDINATDFASMLEISFSKAYNLLASGMYYPYKFMLEFAKEHPDIVQNLFRILHDETIPLAQRYLDFRSGFEKRIEELKKRNPERKKALQHYQDLRAIMVYLTFHYPEKYYLYKYTMFTTFCKRVGFVEDKPTKKSVIWKVESYNRLCEIVLNEVKNDNELISMSMSRLDNSCYKDDAFHLLTMDIIYYGSTYMSEDDGEFMLNNTDVTDIGLNTILYGPPGTGKTYHSVIYAVAIIENRTLASVEAEDYDDVLIRYNAYKVQGRIEFTTFHQSYGYEEFIEGIKPSISTEDETSDIRYSVQPGVFKRFCERAERPAAVETDSHGIGENPSIWKVSLWSTGDNEVRTECLTNGHIRIGWDQYGKSITDETDFSEDGGRIVLNSFINRMQIGDIVFSCYSASTIDAIGVVTGEYEWHEEYKYFRRLRKVNWIVKGIRENILDINGGTSMTLASVYRLSNIAIPDVYRIIDKYHPAQNAPVTNSKENYVFIIDEINRGNISKIFGELITLIESSKRIGKPEGMKAMLPYSQKPFGVPSNIYIIGTMNTADRSIATIDTALRRRFVFKEMLPDISVLKDIYVEDLSVSDMLDRMNKRISVLYDREHTIGHAYFMPLKDNPTIETLSGIFSNSIIPLLQEYFYEDYEKIRLVLGDNRKAEESEQFIVARTNDYAELFGDVEIDLDDGSNSYEINEKAFSSIEAYRSI